MKKVALITGGSRGIGLGIAQALASAGFDIAVNGVRDEHEVSATLYGLRQLGTRVIYCQGSIGIATERLRILDGVKREFARLHVLVNNAGVAPFKRMDILETTEESYSRVMDINLKGPFFLSQQAARWMLDQKEEDPDFEASIINISSISATVASVNRGEYCLSKAGLSMLSQLYAVRLGAHGIPVYEVRPGIVKTDMTAAVEEKYDRLISDGLCVQERWGTPEDVGKAVAALARGDFPYSTGQVIMVDGGLSIHRL